MNLTVKKAVSKIIAIVMILSPLKEAAANTLPLNEDVLQQQTEQQTRSIESALPENQQIPAPVLPTGSIMVDTPLSLPDQGGYQESVCLAADGSIYFATVCAPIPANPVPLDPIKLSTGTNPTKTPMSSDDPLLAQAKDHFGPSVVSGVRGIYGLDNPTIYEFYNESGVLLGKHVKGGLLDANDWIAETREETPIDFGDFYGSREKAIEKASLELANRLGKTQGERDRILNDITVIRADKSSWSNGCVGWDYGPNSACTMSFVWGYTVVLGLYGQNYEYHNGVPDPGHQSPIQPILLENGYVFNHRVSDATGFIREGSVTTNYRSVAILPSSEFGPADFYGDMGVMRPVIGTYSAGDVSYTVYGILENKVYEMASGLSLTMNPSALTGFVRNGNVKTNYAEIGFLESGGCSEGGLGFCWAALLVIPEGVSVIGSYTEKTGNGTVSYYILGKQINAEVTMDDGRVLTFESTSNTGFITEGPEKQHYKNILFHETGRSTCPKNDLSGMPCTFELVSHPMAPEGGEIGSYYQRVGETTVSYVIYAEATITEIRMADGRLLTVNADKTGYVKTATVTEKYTEITSMATSGCNEAMCWTADLMMPEGMVTIGSYQKQVGNQKINYLIIGKRAGTEITLTDGRVLQFNAEDNTGSVTESAEKKNFKNINFVETAKAVCPSNSFMPCLFEPVLVMTVDPDGFVNPAVIIGSYSQTIGETTVFYDVYGEPTTTEITMADGHVLILDIKKNTGLVKNGNVAESYTGITFEETQRCFAGGICAMTLRVRPEGFDLSVIGTYTKQEGDATITYEILGKHASTEIAMSDGRVFSFKAADNTGSVIAGVEKLNYKNIIFSETGRSVCPSNDLSGMPCAYYPVVYLMAEGFQGPQGVKIGSYSQKTGDTTVFYDIYGEATTTEITMMDGHVLTLDVKKNTGLVKNGNIAEAYTDISLEETQRCFSGGICAQTLRIRPEGFDLIVIGTYTKQEGEATVTYNILGKHAGTEITMTDGRVLQFKAVDNTGFVAEGAAKHNYENVVFLETGRSVCPSNDLSGMPCIFYPIAYLMADGFQGPQGVKIGSYSQKMGDTTVFYDIFGEATTTEITMADNHVLIFDTENNTGSVRKGNTKKNYEDIRISVVQAVPDCPYLAPCAYPVRQEILLNEGESEIGTYQQRVGSVTFTYVISGMPTTTEITMTDGRVFTFQEADQTGWLTEENLTDYFKNVSLVLDQMPCDSTKEICTLNIPYVPPVFVNQTKIGTYEDGFAAYSIYGVPDFRNITLENGKRLTVDLKPSLLNTVAEKKIIQPPLVAKRLNHYAVAGSISSSSSFSKKSDDDQEKKKKKRRFRRVV